MNAQTHYQHGVSLQRAGDPVQAMQAFDAAIAADPGFAEAHNSRGIALASLGRFEDALVSFDRALALNPKYAECHNNRGIALQELGRLDAALASFDESLALKSDNARAHNNRGTVLIDLRRTGDALASYDKAIALDPSYAEAFYNRGMALHDLGRFDEALASFDTAIALRPDYAEAHHNRAALLQDLQRPDDAARAYAAAIALHPDHAESYANQAYCLLQLGRFEEGWRLHEWRKQLPVPVGNRRFAQPLWLGSGTITNRTLFVHWEQGLGDTIQFCRYGKLLKALGANVVMAVQEPLRRLFMQFEPQIEIIGPAEVPKHFDYHCPMMSLPLALATTLATIPAESCYIVADEQLRRSWEARLPAPTKPRIGIAWKGSSTHKNDHYRSINPAVLAPLLSPAAHWISLQYDTPAPPHLPLVSFAGLWQDFADVAAVISGLDLVITVDTAVAHLAGAMGKPVFILLPFNADWRWLLDRDDSPWYPSARLFRQKTGEPWQDVIARVRLACQPMFSQPRRQQFPAAATHPAFHAKFREGLALHQQGRLTEAEQCYREVLEQAPEHFDALHFLGVLALQTLRTESGVELITKAVALNPNSFGAYNNLGLGLKDLKRFDAALECFDKAIALRPDYAEACNNRGLTLRELGRFHDALASFDKAAVLKPDYAEAHNNRGVALRDLKRLDEALGGFAAAIRLKPDYVEAYANYGKALQDLRRFADALVSFDKAVALRPDDAAAWCDRGLVLQDLGRFDDALASLDRAITLKPDHAEAYNNRGIAFQELRRPQEAIDNFEKAATLRPNYAEAHHNQSLSLLQVGRFEEGFRLYEWRKTLDEGAVSNRSFSVPLWLGREDISGKTIFVHWEQGLGDTILFSRFATLLKAQGANVVMSVQEPLLRLLAPMKPDIEIINSHELPAEFDYHCPLTSLPLALGTTVQTIPSKPRYVFADAALRNAWSARLPPRTKRRVGIVWRTGTKRKSGYDRSIDLASLPPLLSADVHWISLQKEIDDADAALLRQLRIASYHNELGDFADTAALVDHLDLVVTIDTSVAHLAGAMGKPVWIMLPYNSDWKWLLDRDDTPWYPTARLFRRNDPRSWGDVLARVATALRDIA